jgi:hypothetical protein
MCHEAIHKTRVPDILSRGTPVPRKPAERGARISDLQPIREDGDQPLTTISVRDPAQCLGMCSYY